MYNPQSTSSPFTTFSIPANAKLKSIAWGQNADGNIWFTEAGLGEMGVLTPTSTTPIQLSSSYYSSATTVVAGPDGDYWINDSSNPYVAKATAAGVTPISIPTDGTLYPQGIASLDGEIWFVDYDEDEIGMFDPTTHYSTEYPLPGSSDPDQLIAVNGELWFTDHGSNQIGEFDPTTDTYTAYNLTSSGSGPTGITYDQQDGYFWFTEPNQDAIGFLEPTASGSPSKIYSAGNNTSPTGIVADSNGNLWFTDFGSGAIGEYTPSTATFNSYGRGERAVQDHYRTRPEPLVHLVLGQPDRYAQPVHTCSDSLWRPRPFRRRGDERDGRPRGGSRREHLVHRVGAFTGDVDQYVGSISMNGTNAQDQPTPGAFPNEDLTVGPDGNIYFSSFYTFGNGPGMIGAVTSPRAVATQLAVTTQPPDDVTANEPASNGFGLVVSVENSSGQLDSFFQSNQGSVTIQLVPPAGVSGEFLSGTTRSR